MQIISNRKRPIIGFFGSYLMKIGGLLITQHPSDLRITDTSKHARIFGGSSGSNSNSFFENYYHRFINSENYLRENAEDFR